MGRIDLCVYVLIVGVLLAGCQDPEPVEVNTVEDLVQRPAPPEPPPKERARQIVARLTRADPEDVKILDQAAAGDILTIEASIPAHEKMLPHHAAAPDTGDGAETEQRVEFVRIVWNTAAERPTLIHWPERLQFAEQQPVEEGRALEAARTLKGRWFPEVPAQMDLQSPHRLNLPGWVITWRGRTDDGTLTGDQVVVQVSAVTGLPIEYTQRVAVQRPSREEVDLTREQAIEAAREALIEAADVDDAANIPLVARLVLSSPAHPEGGPVWMVHGTGELAALSVPVDAESGDVLVEAGDAAESQSTTSGRGRPESE